MNTINGRKEKWRNWKYKIISRSRILQGIWDRIDCDSVIHNFFDMKMFGNVYRAWI